MFCRSRLVRDAVGIVVFDEGVASSVVSESFGCVEEEHVSHVVDFIIVIAVIITPICGQQTNHPL